MRFGPTLLGCVASVAAWTHVAGPLESMSAETRSRVIFDVDLTVGHAGTARVSGGAWDRGWKTTGRRGERISFDAGRALTNGSFEVTLAAEDKPASHSGQTISFAGLHEETNSNRSAQEGDVFFARTGDGGSYFAEVIAAGRRLDGTEHEARVGTGANWMAGGRSPITVRFEWRDGVAIFTDATGKATVVPRDVIGGDTPIDRLRYAIFTCST